MVILPTLHGNNENKIFVLNDNPKATQTLESFIMSFSSCSFANVVYPHHCHCITFDRGGQMLSANCAIPAIADRRQTQSESSW